MKILAIDPGPKQSAAVTWLNNEIWDHFQCDNESFLIHMSYYKHRPIMCVIEDMAYYSKVMNKSSFDTLKFIGRLQENFSDNHALVYFPDIAYHFCNSRRGVKTSNINAVLVDRFGGKGTKKNRGIFYGIKEHEWSAVAVAVYYHDVYFSGI